MTSSNPIDASLTKESKLAEDIHDYLDEVVDLLDTCSPRPTMPIQAINSRALVFSEIPRMVEAIEVLTQGIAQLAREVEGSQKLDALRCLERANTVLNEVLPARQANQV